jgi:hypothetical protein
VISNTIIRRIARTALLCGTLGLLLYVVLAAIVENPTGAALLPSLFAVPATVLLLILTVQDVTAAWRTGVFPSRSGAVLREREPVWFWGLMIWQVEIVDRLEGGDVGGWCGLGLRVR